MKTQNQFLLSVAIALGFICAAGAIQRTGSTSVVHSPITYVASSSTIQPVETTRTVIMAPETIVVGTMPESMPVEHVTNASEATPITYCHQGYSRWDYRRGQPVRNVVRFFHNRRPIRSWIRNGGPIRRFFRNGGFFRRGWGCR